MAFRRGAGVRLKREIFSQERTCYDKTHQQTTRHFGLSRLTTARGAGDAHADAVDGLERDHADDGGAGQPLLPQLRSAAIVQLAVFEAVNAIVGDYRPYLGTIVALLGASPDAAAVAAAHRALVTLHPASAVALDGFPGLVALGVPGRPGQG